MQQLKLFSEGVERFFYAFKIIYKNKLSHFYLYPFLIRLFFFIVSIAVFIYAYSFIKETLEDFLAFKNIPDQGHYLSWLKKLIQPSSKSLSVIISISIGILSLLFFASVNNSLSLAIASPILSLAGESAEKKIIGKTYKFDFKQLLRDVFRSILITIRNITIQTVLFGLGLLLLLIPFAGSILYGAYQYFMLIGTWYFIGFSLMDYSCERHRYTMKESFKFIWKNKAYITGIGFSYWTLTFFPLIGTWIGFPLACITGVVASTKLFLDLNKIN
ncbi:MAG: EI24 domain-containing protein [Bacteroidota bacterium]|jgi:CysZ protein